VDGRGHLLDSAPRGDGKKDRSAPSRQGSSRQKSSAASCDREGDPNDRRACERGQPEVRRHQARRVGAPLISSQGLPTPSAPWARRWRRIRFRWSSRVIASSRRGKSQADSPRSAAATRRRDSSRRKVSRSRRPDALSPSKCAIFPGQRLLRAVDVAASSESFLWTAGLSRNKALALKDLTERQEAGTLPTFAQKRRMDNAALARGAW
jgi:hypothetical protein